MDLAGKHDAGAEAAPRVRVGRSSREEASRASTGWPPPISLAGFGGGRGKEAAGGRSGGGRGRGGGGGGGTREGEGEGTGGAWGREG